MTITTNEFIRTSRPTLMSVRMPDTDDDISPRQIIDYIRGTSFIIEYAVGLNMYLEGSGKIRELEWRDSGIDTMLRIEKLHYGSPLEILIDADAIASVVGAGGFVLLGTAVVKLFSDSVSSWKLLEDTFELRRKRKALKQEALNARRERGVLGGVQARERIPGQIAETHVVERETLEKFALQMLHIVAKDKPVTQETIAAAILLIGEFDGADAVSRLTREEVKVSFSRAA